MKISHVQMSSLVSSGSCLKGRDLFDSSKVFQAWKMTASYHPINTLIGKEGIALGS